MCTRFESSRFCRKWKGLRGPNQRLKHLRGKQLADLLDHHPTLAQLTDVLLRWNGFIGREYSRFSDLSARLHLAGDGKRVTSGTLHRTDSGFFVVVVNELPPDFLRLPGFLPLGDDPQSDEVVGFRPGELRSHRSDHQVARDDFHSLYIDWLEVQQPELANRFHYFGVSRIAKGLVFHRWNLPLVAECHRRQSARRVKSLELSYRGSEVNGFNLRQRRHLGPLPTAQHPRKRRVVVEHALERVDDLIIESWLRMLRQATDQNPHALD